MSRSSNNGILFSTRLTINGAESNGKFYNPISFDIYSYTFNFNIINLFICPIFAIYLCFNALTKITAASALVTFLAGLKVPSSYPFII